MDHGLTIVRACKLLRLSRTAGSRMERDRDAIRVLNEIVSRKPRRGFESCAIDCAWTATVSTTRGYIGCTAPWSSICLDARANQFQCGQSDRSRHLTSSMLFGLWTS
jgi:hypothetical protein